MSWPLVCWTPSAPGPNGEVATHYEVRAQVNQAGAPVRVVIVEAGADLTPALEAAGFAACIETRDSHPAGLVLDVRGRAHPPFPQTEVLLSAWSAPSAPIPPQSAPVYLPEPGTAGLVALCLALAPLARRRARRRRPRLP